MKSEAFRYLETQVGKTLQGIPVRDLDEAFTGVETEIARLREDRDSHQRVAIRTMQENARLRALYDAADNAALRNGTAVSRCSSLVDATPIPHPTWANGVANVVMRSNPMVRVVGFMVKPEANEAPLSDWFGDWVRSLMPPT